MKRLSEEIASRDGWVAPGPRANFISVLCLAWPDGETRLFEGKVFGHLVWPPRGGNGFGYDPMFVPDGMTGDVRRDATRGKVRDITSDARQLLLCSRPQCSTPSVLR